MSLVWVTLSTPAYTPPPLPVGPPGVGEPTEDVEAIAWDESPDIPTARFEASKGTAHAAVEVRPPTPRVGERVQVRVSGTDERGRALISHVEFGTGPRTAFLTHADCFLRPGRAKPREAALPSHGSSVSEYVFHAAGRHPLRASVELLQCGNSEVLVVPGEVEVRAGTSAPNARPISAVAIEIADPTPGISYGDQITVRARDPDGFLHHAHVDFGDGTEPETFHRPSDWPCHDMPARHVGYEDTTVIGSHVFSYVGHYTIRATVTTTTCDGTHPQTTTAATTIAV